MYIHKIPTKEIEKKSLNTAIKGSKGTINKSCKINLNWLGYTEIRTFYVAHLSGWDLILGEPALTSINAVISAGKSPVTIQPAGMERFTLTAWKVTKAFQSNVPTATQWIDDYYPNDKEVVVTTAAANIQETFDPVKEFPQLFPKEIPRELPPVHGISHKIIPKAGATWVPAFRPVGDPFKKEISEKINEELESRRIY